LILLSAGQVQKNKTNIPPMAGFCANAPFFIYVVVMDGYLCFFARHHLVVDVRSLYLLSLS
jgi:hypothetical protein